MIYIFNGLKDWNIETVFHDPRAGASEAALTRRRPSGRPHRPGLRRGSPRRSAPSVCCRQREISRGLGCAGLRALRRERDTSAGPHPRTTVILILQRSNECDGDRFGRLHRLYADFGSARPWHEVIGIDNWNEYYDVRLKEARLARFREHPRYRHVARDLADRRAMEAAFEAHRPQRVVNLAAQAGVRYAAKNPHVYVSSNVDGFLHVLGGCRHFGVEHLVFASTSSVYGTDTAMPFTPSQGADHPLTLYAATKKANEMMAHSYEHLYGFPCTRLRFFTVYGPLGPPGHGAILIHKGDPGGRADSSL